MPDFINDTQLLELEGSVSVTRNTFDLSTWQHDVVFDEVTNDRPTDVTTVNQPTYYIEVHDNLNNHLTYHDGNDGDVANDGDEAEDDAYSMATFTINDTAYNANGLIEYSLPTSVSMSIPAARVNVKDADGTELGADFDLTLSASHASDGSIVATSAWSGSSQVRTQTDLAGKAQYAFWNVNDTAARIGTNTAASGSEFSTNGLDSDNLTAEVTTANIDDYYNDQEATVLGELNGHYGWTAWSITFNAIPRDTDNSLSNYARNVGRAGNSSLFQDGDRVVTSGSASYVITVDDLDGNTITLANDTNNGVYGIVKHNDDLIAVA